MGASFYGELVVRYVSDTTGLSKGLAETQAKTAATTKSIERSLGKTGLAMQNVGRTMTQYYTLPVVAGLGYATYAAYKYQKSMIQVQNLTGLSAQQAAKFSDEIRAASAEIGNAGGPQAAADAFYFLASSGLDAKEAMNALRVSMKASVAGMGDVQVLADVVTSAMNSYGHEAYNATQAMDILMRTIEVGKAEPTALASSLGRIMPIANQLDVSLEELGGNVAALTLGGLSSAESVTALRGTMAALVSPAKMSIDTLKTLGLTYKEVTKSIAEKGLLPTLKMLWEETDHNMLLMRQIIPNIRATTGVMSLLGANYEKNLEVIERVNDSQGKLNETYKTASQTDVAKFNRALNELKSTFIEVGAVTLPVVTKLVKWIGDLVGLFNKLSPGAQKFLVWFLAITAAAMPALSVLGSFTRAIGLLIAKRAAAVASSAAEVAANAALVASNGSVAASEVLVADATAGRAAAQNAAAPQIGRFAALMGSTAASIGLAVAGVALLTAGVVVLAKEMGRRRKMEILQPAVETKFFGPKAEEIAAKLGFERVEINGVVYWNYKVEPKEKDPGEFERTLAGRLTRQGGRAVGLVQATEEWVQTQLEKVRLKAASAGGAGSLMALLGEADPEKNKYYATALKGQISEYMTKIAGAQAQIQNLQENIRRGWGNKAAQQEMLGQLKFNIGEWTRTLGFREKALADSQAKMQYIMDHEPEWDLTMGKAKLKKLMQQYLFDMRAYLGKPIKMPRIDMTKGDFKKQVGQLETWINQVTRSRELKVNIKKQLVTKGIKELETELTRVNARIQKGGITANLKADKTKLEDALTVANAKLDKLKQRTITPKAALDYTAVTTGVDAAIAELGRLPDEVVIPIQTSSKYGGYQLPEEAWGGIIKKPTPALVGEDGPEVIIPLTKPARAAQLMKESGLADYAQTPSMRAASATQSLRSTGTEGPVEVHYHNHMTLPQGMVVSDLERFGSTMRPYIEHGTNLAQRRRARGRAGL